jgi:hypothetical protein
MTSEEWDEAARTLPIDQYIIEYDDGNIRYMPAALLSNILQCGDDPNKYGIVKMEQGGGE